MPCSFISHKSCPDLKDFLNLNKTKPDQLSLTSQQRTAAFCNFLHLVHLCPYMSTVSHLTALLIWPALREKVPNVLSRCHTKRRAGAQDNGSGL